jgi:hypothetical protein
VDELRAGHTQSGDRVVRPAVAVPAAILQVMAAGRETQPAWIADVALSLNHRRGHAGEDRVQSSGAAGLVAGVGDVYVGGPRQRRAQCWHMVHVMHEFDDVAERPERGDGDDVVRVAEQQDPGGFCGLQDLMQLLSTLDKAAG